MSKKLLRGLVTQFNKVHEKCLMYILQQYGIEKKTVENPLVLYKQAVEDRDEILEAIFNRT